MAFTRWVGWAREMVRVIRGLPDEELRQKTAAIHEQLVRLRRHRTAHEKEREVAALRDVRRIVDELQSLERNLVEAHVLMLGGKEKATVEYVDTIAEQVTKEMEARLNAEMDHLVNKAMTSELPELQIPASSKPARTPPGSSPNESK